MLRTKLVLIIFAIFGFFITIECKSVNAKHGDPSNIARQLDLSSEEKEVEGEEDDTLPSLTPEDALILRAVVSKANASGIAGNATGPEALLNTLLALDSKEIEAAVKDAKKEVDAKKKQATSKPGKPTANKPTPTTTRPGILSRIRNLVRSGNFSRKRLLELMKLTRRSVEYLEDIGLVNELAGPVLIADDLFTALEGIVG